MKNFEYVYSKLKKHGFRNFIFLSGKYLTSLPLAWASSVVLSFIGIPKSPYTTTWNGCRNFFLRMLGVEYRSEFSLSEPHHFHERGVQDNIIRIIYADPAEGPVTVVNPFNPEDTHTYFWFPRRNYELANVVFDPRSGSVLINSMVVQESSHRFPTTEILNSNLAWRCRNPLRLDVPECSGIQWAFNYAHWLTEDLMSVLRIRKQFGNQVPFITPSKLARFQVEALNLLGVNRIEIDAPVLCNRYFLAGQHQRSQAALRPSDYSLLRQTFLPLLGDDTPSKNDLEIYISRRKSTRSLIQEKELEQMLIDHGFLVVFTEDLDFAEEIALFSRAKTIIGITGSGMANNMWMSPGGRFIEIRINDFYDPSGRYNCPLFGLHISLIDCRNQSFETPARIVFQKIFECLKDKVPKYVY